MFEYALWPNAILIVNQVFIYIYIYIIKFAFNHSHTQIHSQPTHMMSMMIYLGQNLIFLYHNFVGIIINNNNKSGCTLYYIIHT